MRCPECQSELPEGLDQCMQCGAVLTEPPVLEHDLSELWVDGSNTPTDGSVPELMTSAKRTAELSALEAEVARRRAMSGRATGGRERPPSLPVTGPMPAARPRPPTGPMAAAARRPPPPTGPLPQASRSTPSASAPEPARAPFGIPGQAVIPTRLETGDPQANRGTQIVEISLPPAVKRLRRAPEGREPARATREESRDAASGRRAGGPAGFAVEESVVSRGVDEVIAGGRIFYTRMHPLDRWTVVSLALAFIASFLPWTYVRGEGLIAGIQEYGAASAVAAVLVLLCVWGRTARRRLGGLLIVLQILAAAGLTAVPVFRFMTSGEIQLSYGLYLTALMGAGVVLLTLARLTRLSS